MDRDTLLHFIRRIVRGGNPEQSHLALLQLEQILRLQGDQDSSRIVNDAAIGLPDLMRVTNPLDERAIVLAAERGRERLRREQEARTMGRC